MTELDQIKIVKTEMLKLVEDFAVLKFKLANVTTERDVAWQEIERWKGINDECWIDIDRLRDCNTAANKEIEELRESLNETLVRKQDALKQLAAANAEIDRINEIAEQELDEANKEVQRLETLANTYAENVMIEHGQVEKLRDAIDDYIHNDIGRKDTLHNLEKAFFDTECNQAIADTEDK